jgi:inosine-uridine nucleoside N-ribohydrolase
MGKQIAGVILMCCTLAVHSAYAAPSGPTGRARSSVQKIIIDTDIGGDIDDAFAVALALQSPEFEILGITTAWGDTTLRARLLSRLLKETGHADIPVAVGVVKHPPGRWDTLTQARYAEATPAGQIYPNAVDFILEEIRHNPGEITLIVIGPETNIAAAIGQDATTFRNLKRVVIMGGSVDRGYDTDKGVNSEPSAEYNIAVDPPAAQKLFTSGVPLYVMPLDSTQIKLQLTRRSELVSAGTPVTDQITLLYCQWSPGCNGTPTLFDPVAVAYAVHPDLCPTKAMRLRVDDKGYTRVESGEPNVQVCLSSDSERFVDFLMPRLLGAPVGKPKQ